MDNDPVKTSDNEEEYEFVEAENTESFESPRAKMIPPPPEGSGNSRKKLFVIIGVIVAAFCLYKLYGLFSMTPTKPKNEMPVVTQPALVTKPAPVAVVAEQKTVSSPDLTEMQKKVSQVSQSNANLQDQIAGISTAITDIQNNIAMLSQQVTTLTQQSQEKQKVEEAKKTEVKKIVKAKAVVKARSVVRTLYYVKAMIQGRAWLMTTEGVTFTVSEGDRLPGYGDVQSIEPSKGVVITSSGRVIGYKPEDK